MLAVLHHVLPVQNGGHRWGVGGGAADAVLLHGPDQRGIGVPGGGLGEVLVLLEAAALKRLALAQLRELAELLLALLVPALLVDGCIAVELYIAAGGAKLLLVADHRHRHAVIDGIGHLAGDKAAPDQPVEPVLLGAQIPLDLVRGQKHIAGTDGLVGVLCPGLGLEVAGILGTVAVSIAPEDELSHVSQGLLADAQAVGTHVGDEAHGALPGDVHALVELLGDGHGPPGGHVQLPAGLLLEGGGGEGGGGASLLILPLHALHRKDAVLGRLPDGHHLGLAGELLLLPLLPVVAGQKGGLIGAVGGELHIQGPVLLGLEVLDLLLPLKDHPGGHGLDPAGTEAPADLLPQEGTELIAHDPVQKAPGLLGIHQILVDVPGLGDGLPHHLLGDLVEGHTLGLLVI